MRRSVYFSSEGRVQKFSCGCVVFAEPKWMTILFQSNSSRRLAVCLIGKVILHGLLMPTRVYFLQRLGPCAFLFVNALAHIINFDDDVIAKINRTSNFGSACWPARAVS